MTFSAITDYFIETDKKYQHFIETCDLFHSSLPDFCRSSVVQFLKRPGKRLRPALLLLTYACAGSSRQEADIMPAVAAMEIFHTWTLIHDDIIDNDTKRKGAPAIHVQWAVDAKNSFSVDSNTADAYGRNSAMLIGDILSGISGALLMECTKAPGVDPMVVIRLFQHLQFELVGAMAQGEFLDLQSAMQDVEKSPLTTDEAQIVEVARMKSGLLFKFCAIAGYLLGKNIFDLEDRQVKALAEFALNFGVAYQIQDDIIGVTMGEEITGKNFGSDIREGKKTVMMLDALNKANTIQKRKILSVFGNPSATEDEIKAVAALMMELGSIEKAKVLAQKHVAVACECVDALADSPHKNMLKAYARFAVTRTK